MSSVSWTDDRVELLKKLWLEGLSASQIAAQLGGVTRNAVIGKVHRLGMSGRVKASTSTPRSTPRKKPNSGVRAGSASSATSATSSQNRRMASGVVMGNVAMKDAISPETEMRLQQSIEDVVIPMSQELTLLEINEKTCKWPCGDPTSADFSFCGHGVKEGSPYCEYHSKLAFQPSNGGRRRN